MSVVSEGVFLSALQPNNSTVSTYALPDETELPQGRGYSDDATRVKRVQQQVAQRLSEKSTVSRRTNSTSAQYATVTAATASAQYPTSGVSPSTCPSPKNALSLYTFNYTSICITAFFLINLTCYINPSVSGS